MANISDLPETKELKAGWKNEVDVKVFKTKDVAQHKTKKDMWITIHGKVYDVTEYARDHPGGLDVLLEVAGKDATSEYEDVGHSQDASEIMQSFLVGVLEGYSEKSKDDNSIVAKSASEVTVRRHIESKPASAAQPVGTNLGKIVAVTLGTTGLLYTMNKAHLFHSLNSSLSRYSPELNLGGFAQGFLTASVVLGGLGFFAARYINNLLAPTESFTRFPPHIKSKTPPSPFVPKGVLDPGVYQDFKLRSKTELSDGIYKFVFDLPTKYSILGLPIGQHIAIKAEIDEHTVVRSYTPVSNNRDLGRLELLIRVYPGGAIGNYLKNLPVGGTAQIRGPKGAMRYRRGMSKHLGMVGGGTGITPLYQLIRSICEDPQDDTTIDLIYGNRNESDIMLRERLEHYAATVPHKLRIHFVLDNPSPDWTGGKGFVNKTLLEEKMPLASPDTKILLCGPPGMVNAVKSNLVELGFERPAAVSKMTDQIFCF